MPIIYVPMFPGDPAENVTQKTYIDRLKLDPKFGAMFPLYLGKEVLSDKKGNKIECTIFQVPEDMTVSPSEKESTVHTYFELPKETKKSDNKK